MAIEKIITKKSATKRNGIYSISVNLILTDGGVEVVNKDFSQDHNPVNNISNARDELLIKVQSTIDNYKDNKLVLDSTAFTGVVDYINNNIEV